MVTNLFTTPTTVYVVAETSPRQYQPTYPIAVPVMHEKTSTPICPGESWVNVSISFALSNSPIAMPNRIVGGRASAFVKSTEPHTESILTLDVIFLPYVISKRNGVNYGLLPDAMWRDDQRMAKVIGRKLCAVPYVGKDSPSEASEFSSPEVIIGFTILSFRYEGMRRIDVAVFVCELVLTHGLCHMLELHARHAFYVAEELRETRARL